MSGPNGTQQAGNITPGHLAAWAAPGVLIDAGTSAGSWVNSLGVYGIGGTPFTVTNQTTQAPWAGPYNQLGLGISNTAAYISVNALNGATALPLNFILNNTTALSLSQAGLVLTTPLGVASGGTGTSVTPSNGQVLIGNGVNYTASTLTAGTNVTITNAAGAVTISATGGGGSGSGTVSNATSGQLGYYATTGNTLTGLTVGTGLTVASGTITATGGAGVTTFSGGSTGLTPSTPTAGAVTLSGLLAAGSGGTGVTSTSAIPVISTGSTTSRTLAARFGTIADAFDYGATGNGSTDDTTAFNAAVATGKPVWLDPGSYKLTAGSLTGTPTSVAGYSVTLPLNGFSGVTNQGYWDGNSGFYFAKNLSANTGQATVVVNATNNQPSGTTGESGALYVSTVSNSPYVTGLAGIFQTSAGGGNSTASLCSINAYSLWPSGTQGSGSVSEMDVFNSTGTDDAWPINNTTAKTGLFVVSNGSNKPAYAVGVAASGAPFRAGAIFFNGATSNYDLYGAGASTTPRWAVDSSGNFTGQNATFAGNLSLGTFSAAPAATVTFGVGVPSYSAMPGSLYINGNQGVPSQGQLWLNTSVGSAGTSWGQIPSLNLATTFSVSLKGNILSGASNLLDDGSGNTTINGSLLAKSGVSIPGSSTGGTTLTAPSSGSTIILALPSALPTAGQVLTASSVSGPVVTAGWSTAGGSGTVTSVAVSGGSTGLTTSGGPITTSGTITLAGTLAVANGGTGGTTSTGSGAVVLATSPTLTTPALGTPSAATLTNATGLPLSTGVTGTLAVAKGGTGSTTSTGNGAVVLSNSPTLTTPTLSTPNLGTPSAATLTNATGLPVSTGVSGLGAGVATALAATPTGSGALVLATSPTLVTPVLGAASGTSLSLSGGSTASAYTANATITGSGTTGAYNYGALSYSDVNIFAQLSTSVNSYAQQVIQNTSAGATASADLVISNNNGTATTYYGNFGMNSSGFTGSGGFNLPNAVYLSATSGDLVLGTTTSNSIHFVTNGSATDALTINTSGEVLVSASSGTVGNLKGALIRGWDSGAVVTAGSYVMCFYAPVALTIASMYAQVIAPSTGCSFPVSVYIGTFGSGTVVAGLSGITVNNTATTTTATAANSVSAGQCVYIVIGTVTGTSTNAVIQINTVRT